METKKMINPRVVKRTARGTARSRQKSTSMAQIRKYRQIAKFTLRKTQDGVVVVPMDGTEAFEFTMHDNELMKLYQCLVTRPALSITGFCGKEPDIIEEVYYQYHREESDETPGSKLRERYVEDVARRWQSMDVSMLVFSLLYALLYVSDPRSGWGSIFMEGIRPLISKTRFYKAVKRVLDDIGPILYVPKVIQPPKAYREGLKAEDVKNKSDYTLTERVKALRSDLDKVIDQGVLNPGWDNYWTELWDFILNLSGMGMRLSNVSRNQQKGIYCRSYVGYILDLLDTLGLVRPRCRSKLVRLMNDGKDDDSMRQSFGKYRQKLDASHIEFIRDHVTKMQWKHRDIKCKGKDRK